MENTTVGIVGLGLIGGSIAKDLHHQHDVIGYDVNPSHAQQALDLGLISQTLSLEELCKKCRAIILAIPVLSAPEIAEQILNQLSDHQILIDTGSTKGSICKQLENHPMRSRFVACHPLAGTEYSGPKAAISNLFKNKKNIICDESLSADDALSFTIDLMQSLGMQNLFMSSPMHDEHMAYVSHLSHVSSFTLGSTVLDIEQDEKQIFNLASTGFESTVRLAKSSPSTWTDIFLDNGDNITIALNSYIQHLQTIKSLIEHKDSDQLKSYLAQSNEIKRVLTGLKYNIVKIS